MAETDVPSIRWAVDRADAERVVGWVLDTELDEPCLVDLCIDGECIGSVHSTLFRPDLMTIRPDGRTAFEIVLTMPYGDGLVNLADCLHFQSKATLRLRSEIRATDEVIIELPIAGLRQGGRPGLAAPTGERLSLLKGRLAIAIRDRGTAWTSSLLRLARQVVDDSSAAGYRMALAGGSLLGAVREGQLIAHDDDVDLVLIARSGYMLGAAQEFEALRCYLSSLGYRTDSLSNGQFWVYGEHETVGVDCFLGWVQDGEFCQNFAVRFGVSTNSVLPLGVQYLDGIGFPSPRLPGDVLTAIYGPSWETPDPHFTWSLDASVTNFFRPINGYQRESNRERWRHRDLRPERDQAESAGELQAPSAFARWVIDKTPSDGLIINVGCGSGADVRFFASRGRQVEAWDFGVDAFGPFQAEISGGLSFHQVDVSRLHEVADEVDRVRKMRGDRPIRLVAGYILNEIDESAEDCFLLLVRALMVTVRDASYLEFRTAVDAEKDREFGKDFRRIIDTPTFIEKVEGGFGLRTDVIAEGRGLAKCASEDPFVARVAISLRPSLGREAEKW